MKLSIVIPTKNEEKNIGKLLKSIKNQTFQDYEVVVADNQSTDKTVAIAKGYGARVTSGGLPAKGRNQGASIAQADLIFFFDSDVVLPKRFLENNLKEFEERNLDIASCYIYPRSESKIDKLLHNLYNFYLKTHQIFYPEAPGFCILVKKNIHEELGGFDEKIVLGEDFDYTKRASKLGKFRFLNTTRISVSVRRLKKEGRFKMLLKYITAEMYMRAFGNIETDIFNYRFAHYDIKDDDTVLRKRVLARAQKLLRSEVSAETISVLYSEMKSTFNKRIFK